MILPKIENKETQVVGKSVKVIALVLVTWEQSNTYFNCMLPANRNRSSGKKSKSCGKHVAKTNFSLANFQPKLKKHKNQR